MTINTQNKHRQLPLDSQPFTWQGNEEFRLPSGQTFRITPTDRNPIRPTVFLAYDVQALNQIEVANAEKKDGRNSLTRIDPRCIIKLAAAGDEFTKMNDAQKAPVAARLKQEQLMLEALQGPVVPRLIYVADADLILRPKWDLRIPSPPFLILEYVEGRTLTEVVYSEKLPTRVEQLEKVWPQLVAAVNELERVGILHRDLHPDNMRLRASDAMNGERLQLVLFDFGSASSKKFNNSTKAATSYSAPEVRRGSQSNSSDYYSLAALSYRLLTRNEPDQYRRVQLDKVFAPFESFWQRAMDDDPSKRFASLISLDDAFKQALAEFLGKEKKPNDPPNYPAQSANWPLRVAAAAALTVVGIFAWEAIQSGLPSPVENREVVLSQDMPKVSAQSHLVNLSVTPANATVVLNQQQVRNGTRLTEGEYQLSVTAEGYQPLTETINFIGQPLQLSLEPLTATITVQSQTPNVQLQLKGVNSSQRLNAGDSISLPQGDYELTASATHYQSQTQNVSLTSNQQLSINLEPIRYSLDLDITPTNATVFLNDVKVTLPLQLLPGEYRLKVEASGYQPHSEVFSLYDAVRKEVNLRPIESYVNSSTPAYESPQLLQFKASCQSAAFTAEMSEIEQVNIFEQCERALYKVDSDYLILQANVVERKDLFLRRIGKDNDLNFYRRYVNGKTQYVLFFGPFVSRSEAEAALKYSVRSDSKQVLKSVKEVVAEIERCSTFLESIQGLDSYVKARSIKEGAVSGDYCAIEYLCSMSEDGPYYSVDEKIKACNVLSSRR